MKKRKTLAILAVVVMFVYGVTMLLYPFFRNPDSSKNRQAETAPIEATR